MNRFATLAAATAIVTSGGAAYAIEVDLDFSQDGGYFTANPLAKAALEQAASDLSDAILTDLGQVVDMNSATFDSNGTTDAAGIAEFDFRYSYTNPSTGAAETFDPAVLPENVIKVFVGARTLGGSTLGQGGVGGIGVSITAGGNGELGFPSEFGPNAQGAWDIALPAAQSNYRRDNGPVAGNLSGSINTSGVTLDYDIDAGVGIGNIWFDDDTDWHFDHTVDVPFDKIDFYSVALHELVHAIGFSGTDSYEELISDADNSDWLGEAVIELLGSGDGVLEPDGRHLLAGITSLNPFTGLTQEALMDPTIANGVRKGLTELDLAVLEDLGYTVVPEPMAASMIAAVGVLVVMRRRRDA
ncbi:MAG: hypothetical protein AAGK09_09665 [Planctomycetota bacterium]